MIGPTIKLNFQRNKKRTKNKTKKNTICNGFSSIGTEYFGSLFIESIHDWLWYDTLVHYNTINGQVMSIYSLFVLFLFLHNFFLLVLMECFPHAMWPTIAWSIFILMHGVVGSLLWRNTITTVTDTNYFKKMKCVPKFFHAKSSQTHNRLSIRNVRAMAEPTAFTKWIECSAIIHLLLRCRCFSVCQLHLRIHIIKLGTKVLQ